VCIVHGQNANVKANRAARLAEWEARQRDEPLVERDPGEQLLAAAREADAMAQRLRRQLDRHETLDAGSLDAFGAWLDRVGRLSRSVLEAQVDERRVRLAEGQGRMLAVVIQRVLGDLQLTGEQQQLVGVVVPRHLRAIAELEAGGGG
jgi:hypothetical protein